MAGPARPRAVRQRVDGVGAARPARPARPRPPRGPGGPAPRWGLGWRQRQGFGGGSADPTCEWLPAGAGWGPPPPAQAQPGPAMGRLFSCELVYLEWPAQGGLELSGDESGTVGPDAYFTLFFHFCWKSLSELHASTDLPRGGSSDFSQKKLCPSFRVASLPLLYLAPPASPACPRSACRPPSCWRCGAAGWPPGSESTERAPLTCYGRMSYEVYSHVSSAGQAAAPWLRGAHRSQSQSRPAAAAAAGRDGRLLIITHHRRHHHNDRRHLMVITGRSTLARGVADCGARSAG